MMAKVVEVKQEKLDELLLESGTTLHLQAVNMIVLNGMMTEMLSVVLSDHSKSAKLTEFIKDGTRTPTEADVVEMFGDDIGQAASAGERVFTYCAGWGVKDDPPKDDTELMQLLGTDHESPHLRRAAWVRSLLSDPSEANGLIGRVQLLSRREREPLAVDNKE